MSRKKGRIMDRFLAILISVMLIIAMLPNTMLSAIAATVNHPDSFTVTITDGNASIEGVLVQLSAKEDEGWTLDLSATTDEDGVATFEPSTIEQALTEAGLEEGTIKYKATKTGYDDKTDEVSVKKTDLVINTDVVMQETATDLFTITITDGNTPIEGVTVQLSAKEDEGWILDLGATTDEDGVATFEPSTIEQALTEAGLEEGTIKYKATKTGYDDKTDEVIVSKTDLAINTDVTMVLKITYTVSVDVLDGEAEVKLNGNEVKSITVDANKDVTVSITPSQGTYIKSLTIAGEKRVVTKGEAYSETITVDSNIEIEVNIVKEYTLSLKNVSEGGTVKFDGKEGASITVDENSTVKLVVEASEGYQISTVVIGDVAQEISDRTTYTKDIDVNENIEVEVTFVKVYMVTVIHNENGTVVTEPSTDGGNVVVVSGESIKITATPNENYRVSEVQINDEKDETIKGENSKNYTKELTVDKEYTVSITFALNQYTIKADEVKNGTISIDSNNVDHGGSCKVTVDPKDGYSISSIKVNGEDVEIASTEEDNDSVTFEISNIAEDKTVIAEFVPISTFSGVTDLFNDEDAIPEISSENTYVYANGKEITFTTDKDGIRIYDENGKLIKGDNGVKNFSLNTSVTISKIQLRYRADGEWFVRWHNVDGVSKESPLILVIDKEGASVTVSADEKHNDNFYNDNFNVKVDANDDYSGIGCIEYFITDTEIVESVEYENVSDDIKTQRGTLSLDPTDKKYIVNVEVTENRNNSDFVSVWFKITDGACNVKYVRTENYLVNCTNPVLKSITIDGVLHNDAIESYYNDKRTATLVIIDRASSFDEVAATNGISVLAKDSNGENFSVNILKSNIKWNSEGDRHEAIIVFEEDANYEWEISYTNKAGKTLDKRDVVENGNSIYKFTIDTQAPEGTISLSEKETWSKIISTLTFGIWKNCKLKATTTVVKSLSPIKDTLYYRTDSDVVLKEDELEELYKNGEFSTDKNVVNAEEKFVVYARITDYAGNTLYISTNGVIIDTTESKITITTPKDNGLYNSDVNVTIKVDDIIEGHSVYSGIKKIYYEVKDKGNVTQSGSWEDDFQVKDPTYDQLKSSWEGSITVKAGNGENENNSDNVEIIVTVVDNAGNKHSESKTIAINVDELSANIAMDGVANKVVGGRGYFNTLERKAVITLEDRKSSFNEKAATDGIKISAVDKNGAVVENAYEIGEWKSEGDRHSATITFKAEAIYKWSFSYKNKAGNELEDITTGESVTPYEFVLDTTAPTGTVTVNESTWDKLLSVLTFGLYNNVKADISATATDNISQVTIEYYKTDDQTVMTEKDLDKLPFENYRDFSIDTDDKFVIYLKITDYAGNYTYISSNGYIVDKVESIITLTQSEDDALYNANSEVKVHIDVVDTEPSSGIKSVDYWLECDGKKGEIINLFTFDVNAPTKNDLISIWSQDVDIDKSAYNSCNVTFYVKVVDNAGGISISSEKLDIDIVKPSISVIFDNGNDNNGNTYFNSQREATIIITERPHHFESSKATSGIVINAVDAEGNAVKNAYSISDWTTDVDTSNPDASTHTATIKFNRDANYTWSITYTDKAGNANTEVTTSVKNGTSVAAFDFTIDTLEPIGTVKAVSSEGREVNWNTLRNELTFNFWSKDKIMLSGTVDDVTSAPVYSVEYYKVKAMSATDGTVALTAGQLDEITTWSALKTIEQKSTEGLYYSFDALTVDEEEQFVVYVKLTDLAGNYTYISTNGLIIDRTAPLEELIEPAVTVMPEQPINGIYNDDVVINVKVSDPQSGGTYAGIKNITYKVFNMGVETQSGELLSFDVKEPKQSELIKEWIGEITVNSEINNSNDVKIVIYASDNSMNASEGDVTIKVDVTDPVIDISYDNNNSDGEIYFKEDRVATIIVTERNFNKDYVIATITNTDGVAPEIGEWTEVKGTGNEDDTKWIADINYNVDGDYEFDITCNDLAGNECKKISYGDSIAPKSFTIDKTLPVISVNYDNNTALNEKYFAESRTATITFVEHNFDVDRVVFTQKSSLNGKNNVIPTVKWSHDKDIDMHTATIEYSTDGDYVFDVFMTDMAGNESKDADYGNSVAGKEFVIDQTNPTGTIKAVSSEGKETSWNTLANELTFGFWSKDKIMISGTYDDLRPEAAYSIEYYKVKSKKAIDGTIPLTVEQLDKITEWTTLMAKKGSTVNGTNYSFDGISISTEEQFVVYVKLTDLAGNYTYISTNGLIIDYTAPLEETIAPDVTVTPEWPVNGIYNDDVKVDIKVVEPLVGGTYAGLNNITYKVFNMGVETQFGELFVFNVENPKQSELVKEWIGEITVNSEINNSNDVKIVIYASDNSMNASEGDVTIKVDVTDPVIDISYDNNNADGDIYFKEDRVATIVVTERNFNADDVKTTITNTDGVVPLIGKWTKIEGTGNEDDTKWIADIKYSVDGDYTFDITCNDLAGNECKKVSYGDSVSPKAFTVDKTLPVISVNYDNNTVQNGKYFATSRTATVTFTEHNFDENRVVFTQTASLNGADIAVPTVTWSGNGDEHIATIVYSSDGDYTFDVVMTDMAGNESTEVNYGNNLVGKEFVIDRTIAKPTVSGVENGKAYTGDVVPAISFSDVNYASYEVTLVRTRMGEKNVDVTEKFINSLNEQIQGVSGTYDTFEKNVDNDGIYTLTVKMVDKAGNEEVEKVTFTVNRFGSVYEYSDYLVSIIKDGGQYITVRDNNTAAITEDLVIKEYNAERLLDGSLKILVTRDGEAVDVDYTMNPVDMNTEVAIGESGWYEYIYTIKASNFAEDGVYKISLSSAYAAADSDDNKSTSVPENSISKDGSSILDTMNFTVDTTAPEIINILNLDSSNGIADSDKITDEGLEVTYTIVDVGGLKTVEILLNGEVHDTVAGFGDSTFKYNGSFYIPEDTKVQNVRFIVTDLAGNVTDTSSDNFDTKDIYVFNDEVLVTRNFWVRFINNPLLLWGSVGGTVVVLGAAGYFITAMRKRRVK